MSNRRSHGAFRETGAAAIHSSDPIPALVLAAGASRRFGRSKALARWQGQSLLERAITQARQLSTDVRVVTGCRGTLLRYRCRVSPTFWLHNPDWSAGMATSLARGIRSVPTATCGVFVVLVDQPLVPDEQLRQLAKEARLQPEKPLASDYDGRPGVPAYLPHWLWPAVTTLQGDQGAGRVLKAVAARRLTMDGVEQDIDSVEDLTALSQPQR